MQEMRPSPEQWSATNALEWLTNRKEGLKLNISALNKWPFPIRLTVRPLQHPHSPLHPCLPGCLQLTSTIVSQLSVHSTGSSQVSAQQLGINWDMAIYCTKLKATSTLLVTGCDAAHAWLHAPCSSAQGTRPFALSVGTVSGERENKWKRERQREECNTVHRVPRLACELALQKSVSWCCRKLSVTTMAVLLYTPNRWCKDHNGLILLHKQRNGNEWLEDKLKSLNSFTDGTCVTVHKKSVEPDLCCMPRPPQHLPALAHQNYSHSFGWNAS